MTNPILVFLTLSIVNLIQWRFGRSLRVRLASLIPIAIALLLLWKVDLPQIESLWAVVATFLLWFVTALLMLRRLPETPTPPFVLARWKR